MGLVLTPRADATHVEGTIHPEVDAICQKLGVPSNLVYKLDIEPGETIVHMYTPDERGRPRVIDGEVLSETRVFAILA